MIGFITFIGYTTLYLAIGYFVLPFIGRCLLAVRDEGDEFMMYILYVVWPFSCILASVFFIWEKIAFRASVREAKEFIADTPHTPPTPSFTERLMNHFNKRNENSCIHTMIDFELDLKYAKRGDTWSHPTVDYGAHGEEWVELINKVREKARSA